MKKHFRSGGIVNSSIPTFQDFCKRIQKTLPKTKFTWYEKIGLYFCKEQTRIEEPLVFDSLNFSPTPNIVIHYKMMFGRMYLLGQDQEMWTNTHLNCRCETGTVYEKDLPKITGVLSAGFNYFQSLYCIKSNCFLISKIEDLIGKNCNQIIKLGDWNEIPVKELDQIFDRINQHKIPVI
jgi:hypothetical protein